MSPELVAHLEDLRRAIHEARPEELVGVAATLAGLIVEATLAAAGRDGTAPARPESSRSQQDPLLTVAEVAARLKVTRVRVYELVRLGTIPSVSVGRYVRVRDSALCEFIGRNERKGLDKSISFRYTHAVEPRASHHGRRRVPKAERTDGTDSA